MIILWFLCCNSRNKGAGYERSEGMLVLLLIVCLNTLKLLYYYWHEKCRPACHIEVINIYNTVYYLRYLH